MYMMIALTLFAEYPLSTRLDYVKRYYDAISKHKINIPTPIMAGVRTPLRQFASCVLVDSDDTLDSIFSSDMAIGRYVAQRAGIGINAGRIRGVNSKIRGGEVAHTGVIPFLKKFLFHSSKSLRALSDAALKMAFAVEARLSTSPSGTKKSKTSLS
jgi:ribonucleoside-diphosphate reductase alpha chain